MKVLVTGAHGYCGGFLTDALTEAGHDVSTSPVTLDFDWVIHTAARSVGMAFDMGRNVECTRDMIWYALPTQAKIINFSSLSACGEISNRMVCRNTPVLNPSPYGLSKRLSECLLDEYPGQVLSIRLPGVIGKDSHRNWLSRIMLAARAGEIVRYREAPAFNNAIHVHDLCEFIVEFIASGQVWQGHRIVTVGASNPVQTHKVVRVIASKAGVGLCCEGSAEKPFVIDNADAMELGYEPKPILETICYFAEENL